MQDQANGLDIYFYEGAVVIGVGVPCGVGILGLSDTQNIEEPFVPEKISMFNVKHCFKFFAKRVLDNISSINIALL